MSVCLGIRVGGREVWGGVGDVMCVWGGLGLGECVWCVCVCVCVCACVCGCEMRE